MALAVPRKLERPRPERLSSGWSRLRRNRVTLAGFVILGVMILLAIFAPLIAPYGPTQGLAGRPLSPPSTSHLFGTDATGFDVFSRTIYAARLDLAIGFGAVAIALVVGGLLGALAGYGGRLADEVIMRVMDMVSAFPTFILAMGVVAALGPSLPNVIAAIAIVNVPVYARLLRSRVLTIKHSQYVMSVAATGASRSRLLFCHILPNSASPVFVQSTLQAGWAILDAAGLSFIGLGVRVPTAEWGVMINMGVQYIVSGQWWISFFPGIAIAVTVMGFNLIGDGLEELLDPRRR